MNVSIYSGHIFKGVEKITVKDDLRPIMQLAIIDKGFLVATDAHHLVKIDLRFFGLDEESISNLEGKCIDRQTLIRLGQIKSNEKWFIDEVGINILKANSIKKALIYPLSLTSEEGKYPNYEAVIPKETIAVERFSMNAQYLLNIEKIHASYCKEGATLAISMHGTNRAMTMSDETNYFTGLVMPKHLNY